MGKNKKGYCTVCNEYKTIAAYSMCWKHYARWKRHRDLSDPEYVNKGKVCKEEGCEREAKNSGYCRTHYRRLRLFGDTQVYLTETYDKDELCLMPGCTDTPRAEKLCNNHYHNYRYHQEKGNVKDVVEYIDFRLNNSDLRFRKEEPKKCQLPDCEREAKLKGFCQNHYVSFRYYQKKHNVSTLEEYIQIKEELN